MEIYLKSQSHGLSKERENSVCAEFSFLLVFTRKLSKFEECIFLLRKMANYIMRGRGQYLWSRWEVINGTFERCNWRRQRANFGGVE